MQQPQTQNYDQFRSSNVQHLNDPTFIKLKLDVNPLLENVEKFLSAKRTFVVRGEDGSLFEEERVVGTPYANDEGISAILSMINIRANNHTVQGNFKPDQFADFISYIRKEITVPIVNNCYEWKMDETKLGMIIDNIMSCLKPFFTRTIDNKERESLSSQFHSREVISQTPKKPEVTI